MWPVDLAASFPFFPLSARGADGLLDSAAGSASASCSTAGKFSRSWPNISISRMILSAEACACCQYMLCMGRMVTHLDRHACYVEPMGKQHAFAQQTLIPRSKLDF